MSEKHPPKNWKRTGLAVLIIMGSAIVALLLIIRTDRNLPFDSKLWRKEAFVIDGSDLRQRMVNDLQRNVLTNGMTRVEIESLLGKNESGFFSDDYDFVYRLGSESGTGTMTRYGQSIHINGQEQWLALKLNDHGRLDDWRIVKR